MAIAGTTYLLDLVQKIRMAPDLNVLETHCTAASVEVLVRDRVTGQVASLSLRPRNEEPGMVRAATCWGCSHAAHVAGGCGRRNTSTRSVCLCSVANGADPR